MVNEKHILSRVIKVDIFYDANFTLKPVLTLCIYVYITGRNPQNSTSGFSIHGRLYRYCIFFSLDFNCSTMNIIFIIKNTVTFLKYVSIVLRCQDDWKIKK